MKRFGTLVLSVALLSISGVFAEKDEAKKEETKFDAAKLEGTYKITAGWKEGEKVDEKNLSGKVVIKKGSIELYGEKDVEHAFDFKLDTKTTPVSIDLKGTQGPGKDSEAKGIIEIKGDEVKLAYNSMGGDRPKNFESKKESKIFLFVLKKAK